MECTISQDCFPSSFQVEPRKIGWVPGRWDVENIDREQMFKSVEKVIAFNCQFFVIWSLRKYPEFPECTKGKYEYKCLFCKTHHLIFSIFISLSIVQRESFIQMKMAQRKSGFGDFYFWLHFHPVPVQFNSITGKRRTIVFCLHWLMRSDFFCDMVLIKKGFEPFGMYY